MANLNKLRKDILSVVKGVSEQGTSAYDTTAEVRRIEGDTAWVHIAGGVDETPVKLTIAAKAGDSVQVRVGGGRAWITGNATAPPTDDATAVHARTIAREARASAVRAQESADEAQVMADQARQIAEDTNQYFWHTESGTDTGAHITEKTQEEFLADPQNGGGNLLARSNGIAVRDGLDELAVFGANSAQVGSEGTAHLTLDVRGLYITDELNQDEFSVYDIAKDHTEAVVDTFVGDGSTNSFLLKYPVDTISGQLLVTVDGVFSTWTSTVAPSGGIALSLPSTPASGAVIKATYYVSSGYMYSLSLGTRIGKPNSGSAAIGNKNEASGRNSVALNSKTVSASDSQTAIGVLNKRDDSNKYAFLIGNGSDENHRSNAFAVDWNGDIYPRNTKMTDFVTTQGYTTGGTGSHTWYYRKWASGMEEAWGMCSASAVAGSVWASPIYYYNWNVTWPSIFTSAPTQVYITSRNDQWIPVGHGTPTTTGSYIRMMKPSSSSQALAVDIYLVHR